MDRDDRDPALHGVVRRYSLLVAEERPDDTLSQALGANARNEIAQEQRQQENTWPAWLRSHEQHSEAALLLLEKHKRDIAKKWEDFNAKHPGLQLGDVFGEGRGPPRLNDLLQAARDAEATWEKKKESGIGKMKSAVENFMDTMNGYSYLFSVIPSNDRYTSLITGVMTSITKAFVNHKKIAELFSGALETVTKDLATVQSSVRVSKTPQMTLLVVNLYIAVFNLLCNTMDWYAGSKRNRLIHSLRKDYADIINHDTDEVKDALARIRLEADQATQFRVQDSHQDIKDLRDTVNFLSQKMDNALERLVAAGEKNREHPTVTMATLEGLPTQFMLLLGQKAMRTLVATGEAQQFLNTLAIEGRKSPLLGRISDGEDNLVNLCYDSPDDMSDMAFSYTRAAIQEISAPFLEPYLEDGRSTVLNPGSSISKSSLPSEVAQKITAWIRSPSSSFLWVEGPVFTPAERQLSVVAVLLCGLALGGEVPVPCVSFTPKPTYPTQGASDSMSRQERVLIGLLYSLAGQLIRLLPEELESISHSFETQVFERLDGSVASIPAALDLVESLLAHGPPTLMVIINRLQVAECPATTPHLQRLVKLLKAYDSERMVKALFITQGGSAALAGTLDVLTEKVDARRMAQAKPGQPPRGWSSLGNLSAPDPAP